MVIMVILMSLTVPEMYFSQDTLPVPVELLLQGLIRHLMEGEIMMHLLLNSMASEKYYGQHIMGVQAMMKRYIVLLQIGQETFIFRDQP